MTEAEAKGMVEAKLRCMELEGLSCVEKGCDRDCDACKYNYLQGTVGEHKEALRIAINALEKQIAKKLISPLKIENVIGGYCPTCNGTVRFAETWLVKTKGQHCLWCGQKLDWSEV